VRLRIGTRRSPLARAQCERVCHMLRAKHRGLECEIVGLQTSGDRVRDRPLRDVGGKGLFVKELDEAILAGSIDCAVHSLKDVPSQLPDGIVLASVPERLDPSDVLITVGGGSLEDLPAGARLGTASLRRAGQSLARNDQLRVEMLRGNLQTRISRVRDGTFAATMLAAAGLSRLGISTVGLELAALDPWSFVPAVGQGALGLTAHRDADEVGRLLAAIDDATVAVAVTAERAVARGLGGACDLPLGVYARHDGATLRMAAVVVAGDGKRTLRREGESSPDDAEALGMEIANLLASDGAMELLAGSSA
jgi:hydroxymethylbilane synthase